MSELPFRNQCGLHTQSKGNMHPVKRILIYLFSVFALIFLSGCGGTIGAHQQRHLSKPAMQMSPPQALAFDTRILPLVEPGASGAGGGTSSGCASCR